MSRLNIGRFLFMLGLFAAIASWIYFQIFPELDKASLISILLASAVVAFSGIGILCTCTSEWRREYLQGERAYFKNKDLSAKNEAKRMARGQWGNWEDHAQIRRPHHGLLEIRNTVPPFQLAAILLFLAGIDGLIFELVINLDFKYSLGIIFSAMVLFITGYGTTIDANSKKIIRWYGPLFRPLIRISVESNRLKSVNIEKKLGPRSRTQNTGRTVRYPLYLVKDNGSRMHIKPFPDLKKARDMADDISTQLNLPVIDNSGELPETKRKQRSRDVNNSGHSQTPIRSTSDIERYVKDHIHELASEQFPDNRGLDWLIRGIDHKDNYTYVEVEPVPPEAGYSRFKFVVKADSNRNIIVAGVYCLEGNEYQLLFTQTGMSEKLPRVLA